ncbi:MAG: hypothetical protein V2I82_01710 [Halieaceae bacterium]|jgi:hypothetical protein|nr:hypothetical protein [Halieaceae bacterium]
MKRTPYAISAMATAACLAAWMVAADPESGDAAEAGDAAAAAAETARELPPRVNNHRPLRGNPADQSEAANPPSPFSAEAAYGDVPEFSVVPRDDALSFYPCENCHGVMPPNPERRELYSPHPATLDHGAGRIWCLDCHAAENRNVLTTFTGEEFGFNEAYMVCGQCHYQPQKDWFFGGHGKRVATWQGERELYNCTHCHDPHAPAVRPRQPEAPPPIRRGLEAQELERAHHGSVIEGGTKDE